VDPDLKIPQISELHRADELGRGSYGSSKALRLLEILSDVFLAVSTTPDKLERYPVYAVKEDLKPVNDPESITMSREAHKELTHWGANKYAVKMLDFMDTG
jgi:hypothetical protein